MQNLWRGRCRRVYRLPLDLELRDENAPLDMIAGRDDK